MLTICGDTEKGNMEKCGKESGEQLQHMDKVAIYHIH